MVIDKNHPEIYTFIYEIVKEQADTEKQLSEMGLRRNMKATPRAAWLNLQRRQRTRGRTIIQNYNTYNKNNQTLQYLKNMGCNIHIL